MRYLFLPLVAALAFSCCGHELAEQRVSSGDGGVAKTTASNSIGDKLPSSDKNMPVESAKALAAEATKQSESKSDNPKQKRAMSYNKLTDDEALVIQRKGTELPNVGEYTDHKADGLYICRQCNAELYRSEDKFHANCGWPSFDDEIAGAVDRHEDNTHGMARVEIVCSNCKGHLGHVFHGEHKTAKNTRHCVNSISMKFVPAGATVPPMLIVTPK
ncbi:MAG: peptide-methionine (R)-S-oxide reductase [Planctomycetota bacterium]|jgi:peptide-methionine (R)-S-oxide reductase